MAVKTVSINVHGHRIDLAAYGEKFVGDGDYLYFGDDQDASIYVDSSDRLRLESLAAAHKTIAINSLTFTVAASIVGLQVKPRYGVNMDDNCYGMEVEPGCVTGSTFTGKGITGVAARPRMKGGNLSGDVLAFEAKLEYGDAGKTVALGSAALKCILDSNRTFTQGVWPIYVLTGGNTADWTSFALIPDDGVMATDSNTNAPTSENGWIAVSIGTGATKATRYIALVTTKPTAR